MMRPAANTAVARRWQSERGAILIFVGLAIVMLVAFSAFVLDYGVLWVSRRQAQNAADAGALAGITALAKDDRTWPAPAGGVVLNSATKTAQANLVWNVAATPVVSSACPGWMTAPNNINCIQVDVYRDGTNASKTLPVFFAPLLAVTSQKVKATATAQVLAANTSGCMRPWFIPDTDADGDGYTTADIGTAVVFHDHAGPSSYGQLDVGKGGAGIRAAIENCATNVTFSIGQTASTEPGNKIGPETQGMDTVLGWDPGAAWNPTTKTVTGGCAPAGTCKCPRTAAECPYGGLMSPRIVQAAICSPAEAACNGSAPGKGTITITNILSFFLTGYTKSGGNLDINAILIGSAGLLEAGPTPDLGASFLTFEALVR